MRIGVVIHGPEVIDSGDIHRLLGYLRDLGELEVCMGGAMGTIAVIDARLEGIVETRNERVSQAIRRLDGEVDAIVLLNRCKTRESGMAFGAKLAPRYGKISTPLVQADDGFVVPWTEGAESLARTISDGLGMELVTPFLREPEEDIRVLEGIRPGENIWVEGKVIGRATSDRVVIRDTPQGRRFEGMEVKPTGLEKVGHFDLHGSLIRSGSIRRTSADPRCVGGEGDEVILVDHEAEQAYFRSEGARYAVTVGDDTTRIAGALLYRRGVPIIGLTDGDEDGICREQVAMEGSAIVLLRPGTDDLLGAEVRERIFDGGERKRAEGNLESMLSRVLKMGGEWVRRVVRR
ncbi:MAG: DUF2117 domain-containing protein [Methanomassiliicoccales archaeon]